jgi:hypothetical protein
MNGDTRLGCGTVFLRPQDAIGHADEIGHYECPPVMGGQGHDSVNVPAFVAALAFVAVIALFAGLVCGVIA